MQGETKAHLKDHRRVHKQKTLDCSQCGFKAQYKCELARHNMIHSGGTSYVCMHEGCTYASSRAGNLVTHQLVHSNLKPFKCNLCGTCFRKRSYLNCHIRTHTGERPYKCLFKDCDYSATQAGALKQHFRRHTGEKPYKCFFKNCEYSSTCSTNLRTHFRRHTGEKPFRCSYEACEYSSIQAIGLKRHMMTHKAGKVYTCSFKSDKYSSIHASDFKSHANPVHIRNKLHVCQSCEYRSETAAKLKMHIVKNHQKALRPSIAFPCLNSFSSSSLIEIESTKTVSNSKLIKSFEVDGDPKICVRTFVRLTRLKSSNSCYKKDISATSRKNLEASPDSIQKTKSRPGNSESPVDDPKLRIPTFVVLKRLQVNYDSDDDYVGDSLRVKADPIIPAVPSCTEMNTDPHTGSKRILENAYLYTCKICDYRTKKSKKYKSHLQSHREKRQFFCPLCDFVAFKKKLLKSHFRTHDNDSSASESDRYSDTKSHHPRVSITSQEAIFNNTSVSVNANCFEWQSSKNEETEVLQNAMVGTARSVTTIVQLQEIQTKRNQSPTNRNRESQAKKKVLPLSAEQKHVLFPCIFCNKIFKQEMKLLNHLRYHTGEPRPPHLHY